MKKNKISLIIIGFFLAISFVAVILSAKELFFSSIAPEIFEKYEGRYTFEFVKYIIIFAGFLWFFIAKYKKNK